MGDTYTEGISSEEKIQRTKDLISKGQDILADEIKKAQAILDETKNDKVNNNPSTSLLIILLIAGIWYFTKKRK